MGAIQIIRSVPELIDPAATPGTEQAADMARTAMGLGNAATADISAFAAATATQTALDGKVAKAITPINVFDVGVSPTNTAAANTTAFQAAIVLAESQGRAIYVPPVSPSQYIDINLPLAVATGGIRIYGDRYASRIRQTVFPYPAFDVTGPDVLIDNLHLAMSTFNATGFTSTFRDETRQTYSCGVWVGADRVSIRNLAVTGFVVGAKFSSWKVATGALGASVLDCLVDNLFVTDVGFAIVLRGVNGFTASKIRGNYLLQTGVTVATHLIYASGDTVAAANINTNVNITQCHASSGTFGQAYQFKSLQGGIISDLSAYNCQGILNLIDCQDVRFSSITSLNDGCTDTAQGSLTLQGTNTRVSINRLTMSMSGNGKAVQYGASSTDCSLEKAMITTNHSIAGTANVYDVDIQGTRSIFSDISVNNVGSATWDASIGIWGGTGNVLRNPRTSGNKNGLVVRAGTGHRVSDYVIADLGYTTLFPISIAAVGTLTYPRLDSGAAWGANRTLLYDLFDRPFGSGGALGYMTSGQLWTAQRGVWNVAAGSTTQTSLANASAIVDAGVADYDIECGIRVNDRQGIILRNVDATSHLKVHLFPGGTAVQLCTGGSGGYTSIASGAMTVTANRRYLLRVVAYGPVIDVYVDGKFLFSYTLTGADATNYTTPTQVGIGGSASANGKFDNFRVRSLS